MAVKLDRVDSLLIKLRGLCFVIIPLRVKCGGFWEPRKLRYLDSRFSKKNIFCLKLLDAAFGVSQFPLMRGNTAVID